MPKPEFPAAKTHHTPTGFKNNHLDVVDTSTAGLLRWKWQALRQGLPKPPQQPTPVQAPDLRTIHGNATAGSGMQPALTWVGHATMLVQASGLNVLTDPVFSQRVSPVQWMGPKRAQPPGLALGDLPAVDVVLISHNHYDHLDKNSVLALAKLGHGATLFIVPLGIKRWMAQLGITHVVELDWWDSVTVYRDAQGKPTPDAPTAEAATSQPGVEFHFTPVQHWSARSVGDRHQTLWGGWAVFGRDFHWYFSGDTGYSPDFVDTRAHFADRQQSRLGGGFDIALIAVGAYEPRWFMKQQHVNPAEAVQIHRDLGAKRSVGVHWGTFELTDEPLDQPPRDLAEARRDQGVADADFFLMKIGETRVLPRRP